jgi:hypothetical protein
MKTWDSAKRLARRIERDDPQCHVKGYYHFGTGSERYAVDTIDTRTGNTFRVTTLAEWKDRCRAAAENAVAKF